MSETVSGNAGPATDAANQPVIDPTRALNGKSFIMDTMTAPTKLNVIIEPIRPTGSVAVIDVCPVSPSTLCTATRADTSARLGVLDSHVDRRIAGVAQPMNALGATLGVPDSLTYLRGVMRPDASSSKRGRFGGGTSNILI